jgi:sulfonate transport system permease protein
MTAHSAWRASFLPILALVWLEWYARSPGAGSDSIATVSASAAALWQSAVDGTLIAATMFTLAAAASGLALGGLAGVLLGIAIGLSSRASDASSLAIELLRPLPSIALVPFATLIFGFGLSMEIAVVAFATFWPILVLARSAVRQVDGRLQEVARALRFSFLRTVVKFILPSIVPRLFVAIRVGAGLALVVAVTVEVVGNTRGLGYGLVMSQQNLQPALMLGWLAWVGMLGYLVNEILSAVERRAVRRFTGAVK